MSDDENRPEPENRPSAKPRTKPQGAPAEFDFNVLVQQLWHGEIPLLKTFWLYYFTVLFVLKIAGGILPTMGNMFYLLQLIWAGFMVKPIIEAADHYKGPEHWAIAAKIAAVLIGLSVLSQLVF